MALSVRVPPQPDDESCGITCLRAIYRHYGLDVSIADLKRQVVHWRSGGTVGVNLARHALAHGFRAEICTYNIKVFDPTWRNLDRDALRARLKLRQRRVRGKRQQKMIGFYLDFLKQGGTVRFDELDEELFLRLAAEGKPVICGLSATWLYQSPRELPDNREDDIAGNPAGHFVVVSGYDAAARAVTIHDPLRQNPISESGVYTLPFQKFSNAVMLGILTYDANLLVISRP